MRLKYAAICLLSSVEAMNPKVHRPFINESENEVREGRNLNNFYLISYYFVHTFSNLIFARLFATDFVFMYFGW